MGDRAGGRPRSSTSVRGLQFQGIVHDSLQYHSYSKLAQLVSDAAFVDRKIKFRIPARTGLALKHLRNQLAAVLNERLRNKPITESQEKWMGMVLVVLGKMRPELESTAQAGTVVLDVVRN